MNAGVLSIDKNSKEYAIEKVRWIAAHEYAMTYGMGLLEAFLRTALSYAPSDTSFGIDIADFLETRELLPEDDRWTFDYETIVEVDRIMKLSVKINYPEAVLTHMFPSEADCEMILAKAYQNGFSRRHK